MKIWLKTLSLQFKESHEVIDLSHRITFFHGKISAGKSSIMRLVDYCLGGDIERTPAIDSQFVSASLNLDIGVYDVLLERVDRAKTIQVTWRDEKGDGGNVNAPIDEKNNADPIWGENIFNFTDLIFYLLGFRPLKVRKSKTSEDTPLIRLSIRDFLWYCYLDQDNLDSDFFRLEDPFRRLKSRDVMRFVVGYYSETLNDLEIKLEEARDERKSKLDAAEKIREFLKDFGYGSEKEVTNEIEQIRKKLLIYQEEKNGLRSDHMNKTHFIEGARDELRKMSNDLEQFKVTLVDLDERIFGQEQLKAELITAKFKLSKIEKGSKILSDVKFEYCPNCGEKLDTNSDIDACYLCGKHKSDEDKEALPNPEFIRRDIQARIDDLTESIARHKKAKKKQEIEISQLVELKMTKDMQLQEELRNYDSAFLSQTRELDREIATLEERIRGLERISKLPEAVEKLETEANEAAVEEGRLQKEIAKERDELINAQNIVNQIEKNYLNILLKVGIPGVSAGDTVKINLQTWKPIIYPKDNPSLGWNFYSAGSGGKKTMLKVCYALAIHKTARENQLPLPTLLMIDTPMKNIGEDVNKDIFIAFYQNLYSYAKSELSETQLIIIDKEYIEPDIKGLDILSRYMSPDEPLISYYRGA